MDISIIYNNIGDDARVKTLNKFALISIVP